MIVRRFDTVLAATRIGIRLAASYLSAGIVLHAVTAIEVLIIAALAHILGAHPWRSTMLLAMGLIALFTQLDARSRYQEFKQTRDQLMRHGPDRRIFRPLAASRCQRDAALAAARQLGCKAACRAYFSAAGYRWYHLLPDFLKTHPRILVSARFWRKTFFAPTYCPKQECCSESDRL